MLREERSFLAFWSVPAQRGKQAKRLVSLCAKEPLQVSRASKPSIHWSWIRSLHAAALGEMVFFAGLLLRKSVFETSSFTLWQQLTFWLLSVFSICALALLALPHTNENVFTNGNSFSLYFVLAQEPQTTVIHNPDGNKVFRKNQLHLAFPHHTFPSTVPQQNRAIPGICRGKSHCCVCPTRCLLSLFSSVFACSVRPAGCSRGSGWWWQSPVPCAARLGERGVSFRPKENQRTLFSRVWWDCTEEFYVRSPP